MFGQWAVQADDAGFAQQLGQGHVAGAKGQQLRVGVGVVRQQLAAETGHDASEGGPDLAGTDHPDGFAVQVEAGQPVQGEVTFAGAVVGPMQAPVECQDERHGVLGNGVWRVGRHAHHGQAQALGGGQVDVVVAGRAQGDQPRASGGQALQHRRVEFVIDEGADHLKAICQGGGVEGQAGGLEMQLQGGAAGSLGEAFLIVVLAAEQQGAHGRTPLQCMSWVGHCLSRHAQRGPDPLKRSIWPVPPAG
ncbi:hypothetical protein D3C80_1029360 [compost metagenome]